MISTNWNPPRRLRVVVLAAGFSKRLGQPKALARVRGRSLLRRTVTEIAGLSTLPPLVVIPARATRYRAELRGLRAHFVINQHRAAGLSSSVCRAIRAGRHASHLVFLPVDLPELTQGHLRGLIRRMQASPRRVMARRVSIRPALDTTATSGAIPLSLPHGLFARAATIRGESGLQTLLRQLPLDELRLIDLPAAEHDVDTPQDLARARRHRHDRLP